MARCNCVETEPHHQAKHTAVAKSHHVCRQVAIITFSPSETKLTKLPTSRPSRSSEAAAHRLGSSIGGSPSALFVHICNACSEQHLTSESCVREGAGCGTTLPQRRGACALHAQAPPGGNAVQRGNATRLPPFMTISKNGLF